MLIKYCSCLVAFLLFFSACTSKSIETELYNSSNVDKEFLANGISWVGVSEVTYGSNEYDTEGYYKLFFENINGEVRLVNSFPVDVFSGVTWEGRDDGAVILNAYWGGPEGRLTSDMIYSPEGELVLTMERLTHHDFEFFFEDHYGSYRIRPWVEEECFGETKGREREVELKGVELAKGDNRNTDPEILLFWWFDDVKEVSRESREMVNCGYYGGDDVFIKPSLEIISFDEKMIKFLLPDGKEVALNLEERDGQWPTVEFLY